MGWEPIDQPPYKGDTLRFQYLSEEEEEEEVSTHSNSQTGFSLKINSTSG